MRTLVFDISVVLAFLALIMSCCVTFADVIVLTLLGVWSLYPLHHCSVIVCTHVFDFLAPIFSYTLPVCVNVTVMQIMLIFYVAVPPKYFVLFGIVAMTT